MFIPGSDRRALLCPGRLCGVEFPVALFDAASALVPGNRGADMIRASPFVTSARFLESRARQTELFGAQDGRASINFSVLYQLIKALGVMSTRRFRRAQKRH